MVGLGGRKHQGPGGQRADGMTSLQIREVKLVFLSLFDFAQLERELDADEQ